MKCIGLFGVVFLTECGDTNINMYNGIRKLLFTSDGIYSYLKRRKTLYCKTKKFFRNYRRKLCILFR